MFWTVDIYLSIYLFNPKGYFKTTSGKYWNITCDDSFLIFSGAYGTKFIMDLGFPFFKNAASVPLLKYLHVRVFLYMQFYLIHRVDGSVDLL